MAATFELIQGGSVTNFTSIPQTYTDLVLIIDQITPNANNYGYNIRFNNDSGSTRYWYEGQSNYGTSMVRFWSASDAIYPNYSTNLSTYGGSAYMDILDYTSTTHLKPWILQNTNISPTPRPDNMFFAGEFSSTTAITSIQINSYTGSLSAIKANLYGILRT